MNDTKAPNKAPAYTEVARGAGSLANRCPHCEQRTAKEAWPFCSWCRLFVIPMEELNLSPKADMLSWHAEVTITYLN